MLKHPWPYHYYVHTKKYVLEQFPALKDYLLCMLSSCPTDKFLDGPRSSAVKLKTEAPLIEIPFHEVSVLAKKGLDWGMQGTAHGDVQLYMLQNDSCTISVEVPIWLEKKEYEELGLVFDKEGPLSGHIDALRIEDGKIWIWDYKPKAAKEKFADMQVFMYALMLSYRTRIPLEQFMCGYFDANTSYIFRPEHKLKEVFSKQEVQEPMSS